MLDFFLIGDFVARVLLAILPRRIADRVKENISPVDVYVLRDQITKCNEPHMTIIEGVFATILFDLALFGTSNPIINGVISLFTTIQNYWDVPFKNKQEAEKEVLKFCKRLSIQVQPWKWEKLAQNYTSLNDFFSRTYAPEHFPPIGKGRLVSPACCKLMCYESDNNMRSVLIKGCDYGIGRIGLPENDLQAYSSNRVFIGYLSPMDYHRVHSPITGKCIHCKMEGRWSHSASVKFFGGRFNLLNQNKRLILVLEEEKSKDVKPLRVALVIVGGVGVNTISYENNLFGKLINKGQEISTFRAGGSAFVMFSTKPMDILGPILDASKHARQVEVLVGETLAN